MNCMSVIDFDRDAQLAESQRLAIKNAAGILRKLNRLMSSGGSCRAGSMNNDIVGAIRLLEESFPSTLQPQS